ncbi:prepilin peptidase [Leucobacter komagatae]|uniref:prepilin peptidase n=1 Tax=Leucobacter komagatae TaxID=55969 RepID=UPI001476CB84|nr:prepilin peptidase [Leucobacter komagatae]
MARKSPRGSCRTGLRAAVASRASEAALGALGAVAGGAAFALLVPAAGVERLAVVGYAGYGGWGALLIRADLRDRILPNRLLAGITLWTVGWLTLVRALAGEWRAALWPILIAALAFAAAFSLWIAARRPAARPVARPGIGGGDVKLLPVAAFAAVWPFASDGVAEAAAWLLAALAVAFAVAGVVAFATGRREIAAGPAILGASWLALAATAATAVPAATATAAAAGILGC